MCRLIAILLACLLSPSLFANDYSAVLGRLKLPSGFKISVFADQMPTARSLAVGRDGVVFVGTREGSVYAIQDADGDGQAEKRYRLIQNLYMPNGVAYQNGTLYVAEVNRILRFDQIDAQLNQPDPPKVIFDQFPSEKHHGWKYLRIGPDGKLYTAIGAPCNICEPADPIFTSLVRMNTDGGEFEILAKGIRNSVGFDWQPNTANFFFHDNGRDYLGDDSPPEELNQWHFKGEHFGFPYCHAGNLIDPEMPAKLPCNKTTLPEWKYKAHIAPLGMRFYRGKQFPKSYYHQLFVAQHGSWNRKEPAGYQVAMIHFRNDKPEEEVPFITGWLAPDGAVIGRPVDIVELPNGNLLISDDKLGLVYRVEYKSE